MFTIPHCCNVFKFCSLLIGTSSGISWLSTSSWAKTLPTIQVLDYRMSVYASMKHDHQYFGLASDHIIELPDTDINHVSACVSMVIRDGFAHARRIYDSDIPLRFRFYFDSIKYHFLRSRDLGALGSSIRFTIRRYGFRAVFFFDAIMNLLETVFVLPIVYARKKYLKRNSK